MIAGTAMQARYDRLLKGGRKSILYRGITAALKLIKDRKHWTKGSYARSLTNKYDDVPVADSQPETSCYCMIGAVAKGVQQIGDAASGYGVGDVGDALHVLKNEQGVSLEGHSYIQAYNDTYGRTHADVIGKLKELRKAAAKYA